MAMKVCSLEDIVVVVVELDVVGQKFEDSRGRSRASKLKFLAGVHVSAAQAPVFCRFNPIGLRAAPEFSLTVDRVDKCQVL
jgi:hypothetical protein